MSHSKRASRGGFTLIEVAIAISSVAILTLGVGVFLANGQRSWNSLFDRVYSDSTVDGFAIQKVFGSVCRKASMRKEVIGDDGDSLELYYWDSGSTASTPENYARFYLSDDDLYVEHGTLESGTWQPAEASVNVKVVSAVEALKFDVQGASVQMYVTCQEEGALPVFCSTVRRNY